ncbi:MAG: ABC transporter ATP-binding protein [Bdellovibrionia bacterium]
MAKVELRSVRKSFGAVNIIPELNLEIGSGEFISLVGPSGCGKSTILRMVAGLEDPTAGEIKIDGRVVNRVSPKDRGLAMVFQNYALYPHMTVRQNLGFALKLAKLDFKEAEARIQETSEILGLQELLDRKPSQLSGGQKQRVAMGRAMVRRPKVLLFDEPLSNLDAQLRIKVRSEIAHLHKKLRSTVIYVTHDQVEAMTLSDRIVVLNRGNLEQVGAPLEVYHKPRTKFVASFIGTPPMNFISASQIPAAAQRQAETVAFRPECTKLSAESGAVEVGKGRVSLIEPLGSTTHVHVRVGEQSLIAELKSDAMPKLEDELSVWVSPKDFFFFDSNGVTLT